MDLRVQVAGLTKAAQLRRFAASKFEAALARFSHSIQEANVRLNDINGPDRGGVDKLCRLVLRFKDNSIVVIEELGSDGHQVIDQVVDRLRQSEQNVLCRTDKNVLPVPDKLHEDNAS